MEVCVIKKIFKLFTTYFVLLSLLIIYAHYKGQDSIGLILFGLNPILYNLRYTDFANEFLNTGPTITCGSLAGEISIYWYVAHLFSFVIYGLIIDTMRLIIKIFKNAKKKESLIIGYSRKEK